MGAWLDSLMPWGHSVIKMVQTLHHPALHAFFKSLTFLGDELGYMLLLPAIYWCISAKLGRRLGVLVFAGLSVNLLIKAVFGLPRPDPSKVTVLVHEESASFPSGHAQGTIVMWGYIWTQWKNQAAAFLLPALILLIGFSRVYLGAHFPQDILGGWLIGGSIVAAFVYLEPQTSPVLAGWSLPALVGLACAVPLAWFGLAFVPGVLASTASVAGSIKSLTAASAALLGFSLGLIFERRHLRFGSDGPVTQRSLRFVIGLLPVALVLLGLKLLFPSGILFRFVRYALTGFVAAYVSPWIFLRLKLASAEPAN